jgi:hypothetical protein
LFIVTCLFIVFDTGTLRNPTFPNLVEKANAGMKWAPPFLKTLMDITRDGSSAPKESEEPSQCVPMKGSWSAKKEAGEENRLHEKSWSKKEYNHKERFTTSPTT